MYSSRLPANGSLAEPARHCETGRGAIYVSPRRPCPLRDFVSILDSWRWMSPICAVFTPRRSARRRASFVGAILNRRWDAVAGLSIVGLGYATPYLELFQGQPLRLLAMMPAEQGVVNWPASGAFRLRPDRRFDAAAARFLRRPHPARPCAGNRRTSARIAGGSLARADAGRPPDRRRAQSLRISGRASTRRLSAMAVPIRAANCSI